jgi:UDP-N-acetylmuramate dehydrogenase
MNLSIQRDMALQSLNTLALPARAMFYAEAHSDTDIVEAVAFAKSQHLPLMVIGEGSNIVLADDFLGLVLHIKTRGITVTHDLPSSSASTILVTVAAGENWHQFVRYSLSQGWYGLENLALIPGLVGAAPIQNIGAYGLEVSQRIVSVTGWYIDRQEWQTLSNAECLFAYRDSIFKQQLLDRFIVSQVTFALSLAADPIIHYPPLFELFNDRSDINPQDIADAVEKIRREKLPDPQQLPNAGSFFKNPVITSAQFDLLKASYPAMPCFPQAEGVKIPAAWLIDQAGWKGYRENGVGVHASQALVLINYAGGTGQQLLSLAKRIQEDVFQRYGVALEMEPRIYP